MRRFGVEIEAFGLRRADVVDALRAAGLRAILTGRTSADATAWSVVGDGSVPYGFEAVSPILSGSAGLAEVANVCHVLQRRGARVDRRTGLHVHVDAGGLSARALATVICRYARFERQIDTWMPQSRRGNANRYCRSVTDADIHARLRLAVQNQSISSVVDAFPDRYRKVNPWAYRRHKTIEFRHHSGSINADKVCFWVRFVLGFVERSIAIAETTEIEIVLPAGSVAARLATMLLRPDGASMEELTAAFGWQPHSIRAALSTQLRRRGMEIETSRSRTGTRYRLTHANMHAADDVFAGIDADVAQFFDRRRRQLHTANWR